MRRLPTVQDRGGKTLGACCCEKVAKTMIKQGSYLNGMAHLLGLSGSRETFIVKRASTMKVYAYRRPDYLTALARIKNCTIPSLVTQNVVPFVRVMPYIHNNDINNKTHTSMYKYT